MERRGARTDEYVGAMRALWASDGASFDGEFASFTACVVEPEAAAGAMPIVVGGHSPCRCERAGRLGDGFFPGKGSPAELAELIDIVRQTAAAHDRDPRRSRSRPAARRSSGTTRSGRRRWPRSASAASSCRRSMMKPNAGEAMDRVRRTSDQADRVDRLRRPLPGSNRCL